MAKVKRRRGDTTETESQASVFQRYKWVIGGAIILLLIVGFVAFNESQPEPGESVADLGNRHIQPPQTATYNSTPPTSGPHYGNLARWGIHEEPVPNELQVHNLEDGGVMVQYNCPDGCEDLVQQLEDVVSTYEAGVILAPYPDMDSRIALTAWTRILKLDEFDEQRITNFINAYRGIDHHVG